jgi:hypothetical protein
MRKTHLLGCILLSFGMVQASYAGDAEQVSVDADVSVGQSLITGMGTSIGIVTSAAAAAAVEDQLATLQTAYAGIMSTMDGIAAAANGGKTPASSVTADGTTTLGFRQDLLADATFDSAMFSSAEVLIDGSVKLVLADTFVDALKSKTILLMTNWVDSDDATAAAEDQNGPDGVDIGSGFLCVSNIAPDPAPVNSDGDRLTGTDAAGFNSQHANAILAAKCQYQVDSSIETLAAFHDNDGLQAAGGFCTLNPNSDACPD